MSLPLLRFAALCLLLCCCGDRRSRTPARYAPCPATATARNPTISTTIWIATGLLLTLLGLIGLVILVGVALPVSHSATSRAVIPAAPTEIWSAITDYEQMPQWRTGLKRVEPIDRDGKPAWIEHTRHGALPMIIERSEEPSVLIGRIADDNLPFGGTWTYRLKAAPEAESTTVSITEDGEVYNPIFRFISRFVIGYHGTMDQYLRDLGRKFGAEVEVEHE